MINNNIDIYGKFKNNKKQVYTIKRKGNLEKGNIIKDKISILIVCIIIFFLEKKNYLLYIYI